MPNETVVVVPKNPASSKIAWSALAVAVGNGLVAAAPGIVAALPAATVPVVNVIVGAAILAFRLWSSGAPLQRGAGFRIGK
jgi:hypothetical protein